MNTYQDLMHHFKIICQLFVHLAVQRPKDRRKFMEQSMKGTACAGSFLTFYQDSSSDQYFAVPLQIARRKLEGMRDSLVTSSVWRPGFKKVLGKFPEFETTLLDFVVPGCDACHLGGRMSKLVGRLSGKPYDKVTFKVGLLRHGQVDLLLICLISLSSITMTRIAQETRTPTSRPGSSISVGFALGAHEHSIDLRTGRYELS